MIKVGDIIEFTPTYETTAVRATVVKHITYAWCPSANTIHVFADRPDGSPRNLFVLSTVSRSFQIVDPAPDDAAVTERLARATEAHRACLAQHRIWRERFAAGEQVPAW